MRQHAVFFIYHNVGCIICDLEAVAFVFLVDFEGKISRKKPAVFSRDDIHMIIRSLLYSIFYRKVRN